MLEMIGLPLFVATTLLLFLNWLKTINEGKINCLERVGFSVGFEVIPPIGLLTQLSIRLLREFVVSLKLSTSTNSNSIATAATAM